MNSHCVILFALILTPCDLWPHTLVRLFNLYNFYQLRRNRWLSTSAQMTSFWQDSYWQHLLKNRPFELAMLSKWAACIQGLMTCHLQTYLQSTKIALGWGWFLRMMRMGFFYFRCNNQYCFNLWGELNNVTVLSIFTRSCKHSQYFLYQF